MIAQAGGQQADGSDRFECWMHEVDTTTWDRAGISTHDLPDQPFRDYWDSGLNPAEVVEQVLEDEGWEGRS